MNPKRFRNNSKRPFIPLLLKTAVLISVIFLFSRSATLSEWYMRTIYPVVATVLSFVSNAVPFSMYDLFLIIGVLWLLLRFVLVFVRRRFGSFVRFVVRFVAIIAAWFYFGWGIAYFRSEFNTRCNIPREEFNAVQFESFAKQFIEDANNSYVDYSGLDRKTIIGSIESSYAEWHNALAIAYPNGKRRAKPMLFESVYTRMGVSGYFGPFFNEIHVNNHSLDSFYPFTLAHEMAHQFGVALESEANLYAFVVCSSSSDARLRYSAYASTLLYVLNDVRHFLPDEYESLFSQVRPEIIADLKTNRTHWLSARNETLSNVQNRAYDAYLKTNRIESGRENYSQVVALIVSSYGRLGR